jgi:hypothetical protein
MEGCGVASAILPAHRRSVSENAMEASSATDDYDKLSDEELSAKVAEEVMGWERHPVGGTLGWWSRLPNPAARHTWSPATSIADAWEVVEKMQFNGYRVEIYLPTTGPTMHGGQVFPIVHVGEESEDGPVPRAICVASLRALRGRS